MELPKTWKTYSVNELGVILKGKGIAKDEVLPEGLPCIRYGEIYTTYNNYFAETVSFINEKSAMQSQEIKNGDILFAGSGETVEEIGKCVAYVGSKKAYAGGDLVILRPKNVDSIFLAHVLNSDYVVKQKAIFGQGNSVVHIYPNAVGQLIVHLPVLAEQKKIAEILSAWDKAIDKQTKLITAKEKRKKALMQKLLSGEVRFKGFEDEWQQKTIAQVCKTFSGGTPSRSRKEYYNGSIPWMKSGELNQSEVTMTEEFITEDGLNSSSAKMITPGTVVLALYGATAGVVGVSKIEAAINQAILALIPNDEELTNHFLFQLLKWIMPLELNGLIQGAQPNLSADLVKSITINFPSRTEQDRITSFLSACDLEIQKLKRELEALRQQKKGLMQNLLTGKIRVSV